MAADTGQKCAIYDSVRRCPIAVAGDYDDGEEHEGKCICSSLARGFESGVIP